MTTYLSESFDAGSLPAGWSVDDLIAGPYTWTVGSPRPNSDADPKTTYAAQVAVDGSMGGDTATLDTCLVSPTIDTSAASNLFVHFRYFNNGDIFTGPSLEASTDGGSTWASVWSYDYASADPLEQANVAWDEHIDISAYSSVNMVLRWRLTLSADFFSIWQIDTVVVDDVADDRPTALWEWQISADTGSVYGYLDSGVAANAEYTTATGLATYRNNAPILDCNAVFDSEIYYYQENRFEYVYVASTYYSFPPWFRKIDVLTGAVTALTPIIDGSGWHRFPSGACRVGSKYYAIFTQTLETVDLSAYPFDTLHTLPDSNLTSSVHRDIWEYDPSMDTWTQKSNMPIGLWGYSFMPTISTAVVDDRYIYVVGNLTGSDTVDYHGAVKYDTMTDTWTQIGDLPIDRGDGMAAVYDPVSQLIYLLGGFDDQWQTYGRVDVYDPGTDSYLEQREYGPKYSFGNWAVNTISGPLTDGRIVMQSDASGDLYGSTWAYDITEDRWDPLQPFVNGTYASATYLGDFIVDDTAKQIVDGVWYALGAQYVWKLVPAAISFIIPREGWGVKM